MPTETKLDKNEIPDVNREGWSVERVTDEATNKSSDETLRQVLRGDETKGDPDDRDIVGGVNSNETPHGREEAKKDETRGNS
ncbi:MAG: hypothetical protein H0W77_07195 [Acidobacteria bacterium]|nr:hypothetical protein [Acidobacteriota bacterium]